MWDTESNRCLYLIMSSEQIWKCIVEFEWKGEIWFFNVIIHFGTLVEDIKFKIQDQLGFSWDKITITSRDKELEDYESIKRVMYKYYNITL